MRTRLIRLGRITCYSSILHSKVEVFSQILSSTLAKTKEALDVDPGRAGLPRCRTGRATRRLGHSLKSVTRTWPELAVLPRPPGHAEHCRSCRAYRSDLRMAAGGPSFDAKRAIGDAELVTERSDYRFCRRFLWLLDFRRSGRLVA